VKYRASVVGSLRIEQDGDGGREHVVPVEEEHYDGAQLERRRALDDGRSVLLPIVLHTHTYSLPPFLPHSLTHSLSLSLSFPPPIPPSLTHTHTHSAADAVVVFQTQVCADEGRGEYLANLVEDVINVWP